MHLMQEDRDSSDLFQQCALFRGISPVALSAILQCGTQHYYNKGEFMTLQGEPCARLIILCSGLGKCFDTTDNGEQLLYSWVTPGAVFSLGALGAKERTQPVTFQSVYECMTMEWSRDTVIDLADRHPLLLRNGVDITLDVLYRSALRLRQIVTQPVSARVANVLDTSMVQIGEATPFGVEVEVSDEDIAQLADTTLFSVSRLMQRWVRDGVLTKSRGRICIHHGVNLAQHAIQDSSAAYETDTGIVTKGD